MKKKFCYLIGVIYLLLSLILFITYMNPDPGVLPPGLDLSLREYLYLFLLVGLGIVFISNYYIFVCDIKKAIIVGAMGYILYIIIIGIILLSSVIFSIDLSNTLINIIFYFLFVFNLIGFNIVLFKDRRKLKIDEVALIKKIVLGYATQHTRLEIREISEKCHIDKSTVTDVIREMVKNGEVYADYFSISKSIVFDQQVNIEKIDVLMAQYEREINKIGKKEI